VVVAAAVSAIVGDLESTMRHGEAGMAGVVRDVDQPVITRVHVAVARAGGVIDDLEMEAAPDGVVKADRLAARINVVLAAWY